MVLGQSVTLTCQVLAQPAAQATWSKGKELSWRLGMGMVRESSHHRPKQDDLAVLGETEAGLIRS